MVGTVVRTRKDGVLRYARVLRAWWRGPMLSRLVLADVVGIQRVTSFVPAGLDDHDPAHLVLASERGAR